MRTHKAEPAKSPKRPPVAARAGSKKKASKRAAPKKSASVAREARLVSHENDLFDEEEDFESPRRNPSQARPGELDELDKPRRSKRSL